MSIGDNTIISTTYNGGDVTYTVDGTLTVTMDQYGYASITTDSGIFTASTTNWPKITCPHVISADLAEYIDGTVYSVCEKCKERVQLSRIPGGLALLAARSLVIAATEGITGDVLNLMKELSDQIEENRDSLREMEGLLDVVKQLVRETYE